MAETLSSLSNLSFVLAAICASLTIFFWFYFKIPRVFGDLTGRTAKRSIAQMRAANEKSGVKSYRESRVNLSRGKLTDTMSELKLKPEEKNYEKVVENPGEETGILNENREGNFESEATGLLMEEEETTLLAEKVYGHKAKKKITMIEEVMIIHTEEVIE